MKLIPNNNKKLPDGSTHIMNNKNTVQILGRVSKKDPAHPDGLRNSYLCVFPQTGYQGVILERALMEGTAFDPLEPTIYGKACIGEGPYSRHIPDSKEFTKEYKLWYNMLKRVLDEGSLQKYPSYRNVTIHPRWLNFQNFCEDLPKLPNYDLWVEYTGSEYHFDKDLLSEQVLGDRKEYGSETVMFLHKSVNMSLGALTGFTFFKYNMKEKTYITFTNITKFSEETGIKSEVISRAVKQNREVKGYFYGILPKRCVNDIQYIQNKYEEYLAKEELADLKWALFNIKTKEIRTYKSIHALCSANPRLHEYNVRDCAYMKTAICFKYYHVFRLPEDYESVNLLEFAQNHLQEVIDRRNSIKNKPFIAQYMDEAPFTVTDYKQFTKDYQIYPASIYNVLAGGRKSHKGWKFTLL